MRRLGLVLAITVSIVACSTDPEGTRLGLRTADAGAGAAACSGAAAAAPFRIERDGDDMVFADVATGERRSIIWPFGFAAWLEYDVAVLYTSDGAGVGREGDVLSNIFGVDVEGNGLHVCAVGVRTYT